MLTDGDDSWWYSGDPRDDLGYLPTIPTPTVLWPGDDDPDADLGTIRREMRNREAGRRWRRRLVRHSIAIMVAIWLWYGSRALVQVVRLLAGW